MLTQQMLLTFPHPPLSLVSSSNHRRKQRSLGVYPAAPAYCPQRQRNIYNPQPRLCLMRSGSEVNE